MQERLQKIIARAGVASRRHAEALIAAGAVTVNGAIVTELGSKADAARDHIKVNGKLLSFPATKRYIILNKPDACVATLSDPEGRATLANFLHGVGDRVFPAGRLDYHAEGLLLLTSDGELANRILRAGDRLEQVYRIKVKSRLAPQELAEIARRGGAHLRLIGGREAGPNPWYEVTLRNAPGDALRNHLFQTGHPVEKLKRVGLGPLQLGNLESGRWRELEPGEVAALERALREGPRADAAAASRVARPAHRDQRAPLGERRDNRQSFSDARRDTRRGSNPARGGRRSSGRGSRRG